MTQSELNRKIAMVTGESSETIAAMGFSLLVEPPPLVVVDRRARLGDLTRQRMRQRLKSRETPARKPRRDGLRTAAKPAAAKPVNKAAFAKTPTLVRFPSGGISGSLPSCRRVARIPEWREWITPMPCIRTLTFDLWRA